jgi:hypothetical protein
MLPSVLRAANAHGLDTISTKPPPVGAPIPPKLGLPHALIRPTGMVVDVVLVCVELVVVVVFVNVVVVVFRWAVVVVFVVVVMFVEDMLALGVFGKICPDTTTVAIKKRHALIARSKAPSVMPSGQPLKPD